MQPFKTRKRVPSVLIPILNRKEIKRTFNSQAELEVFNTLFNEAVVIVNSGLPLEITTPIVLDKGLEQYRKQLKSITPNPTYLKDVVALYLAYSKQNVTVNEQRRRVLFFDTLPSIFNTLHIPIEVDKVTSKHLYLLSQYMGSLRSPSTKELRQPQTVNREIKMIRSMVNYGIQTGLYSLPNTMPTIKLSNSPIERTSLPNGTLTLIEPLVGSKAFLLLQVIYYSGMRNSEVSKCTIKEVDGVMCFSLSNTLKLKTKQSARLIPMHPNLLPHIEDISTFTLTSVQTLARHINKALSTLYESSKGMYTLYSARHSFSTNLIRLSIPPHIVSELLGHSKGTIMTLNTYYSGASIKELQRVVNLL